MNSEPRDECIKIFEAHLFKSAYGNSNNTCTTYKQRHGNTIMRTIDYIFSNRDLAPVKILDTPTKEQLLEIPTGLPCSGYPSDHIALFAEFVIL